MDAAADLNDVQDDVFTSFILWIVALRIISVYILGQSTSTLCCGSHPSASQMGRQMGHRDISDAHSVKKKKKTEHFRTFFCCGIGARTLDCREAVSVTVTVTMPA